MRIRILILFYPDADLDPNFHPDADADPDPDPSFQKRLKPLKKCQNRLIFHKFWPVICKLINRIRIRFRIQLYHLEAKPDPDFDLMRIRIVLDADPDPDPGYQNDADPCRSGPTNTAFYT
jgi:hypothetical protein